MFQIELSILDKQLREITDFERKHSGAELSFPKFGGSPHIIPIERFLKPDQNVAFFKHPRFIKFTEHRHSFIEMNYVYSGTCIQVINGKEVILKEGDLCILDTNVLHDIHIAKEEDIIINIMIRPSHFDSILLHRMAGNDLLTDFFVHAIYEQKKDSRYILFLRNQNHVLKDLILRAIWESFHPQLCSSEAINSYMLLIFTELLRMYDKEKKKEEPVLKKAVLSDILSYMEQNYQSITLEKTAEKFHFHPNYLTRILKNNLGKTFMELSHQLKNKKATSLLENTDLTIEQIANQIGYSNVGFFINRLRSYMGLLLQNTERQRKLYSKQVKLSLSFWYFL
ncbi:AraC family transcriptional regulator [Neobacillus sp. 3P2-tot-E-2]|uniref:AraC family transcriptional regulator n=1 Tax=Neobacillus sp. 3P2-tot-E-2 TaxID=3132212 RepID=UPI0039A2398F